MSGSSGARDGGFATRGVTSVVVLALGVVYTLAGLAGFFVSDTLAGTTDDELLGLFQVNHLHNTVHLLLGVALVAASQRPDSARGAGLSIGLTYLALGVTGPVVQDTGADVLALDGADHVLHLASGTLLTAVALLGDRNARSRA